MFKLVLTVTISMLSLVMQSPIWASPRSMTTPEPIKTPGWGAWRSISEVSRAKFDAGFSNLELGGYMDFQAACANKTGLAMNQVPNWFRLSNLIDQIGTGEVEYGCWSNGKFVLTMTSRAIRSGQSVDCLRVMDDRGVAVFAVPNRSAKRLRFLSRGATVKPDSYPASVQATNGENWVAVVAPVSGWILQGRPESIGNLRVCQSRR